jgi:hypothetical protein
MKKDMTLSPKELEVLAFVAATGFPLRLQDIANAMQWTSVTAARATVARLRAAKWIAPPNPHRHNTVRLADTLPGPLPCTPMVRHCPFCCLGNMRRIGASFRCQRCNGEFNIKTVPPGATTRRF